MIEREVFLSARGLMNVAIGSNDDEFTFIVDNKKYYCNKFFADFISPKVAEIHFSDSNADHFVIDISDKNRHFEKVMKLMRGFTVEINEENAVFLTAVAEMLGNKELVDLIGIERINIDNANVMNLLLSKLEFGFNVDSEINFIAEHIVEFNVADLVKLNPSVLLAVLKSSALETPEDDEKWLLDFINEVIELGGDDYKTLYQCLPFEDLPVNDMRSVLNNIDLHDVNLDLWEALCRRLTADPMSIHHHSLSINIVPHENEPLNGIIEYLTVHCNGNVHEKGIVNITAENCVDETNNIYKPYVVANHHDENFYWSKNQPGNWIMFDFNTMTVALTNYTLKTYDAAIGCHHFKSWVVEGSNNGEEWIELDRRENNYDLNKSFATKIFQCSTVKQCRWIKIRMTGPDHAGYDSIKINAVEFFGTLYHVNFV